MSVYLHTIDYVHGVMCAAVLYDGNGCYAGRKLENETGKKFNRRKLEICGK